MPYHIGERGSYGCSGYPVVKTSTGEVMGCHPIAGNAGKQLAALHINEPNAMKADGALNPSSTPDPTYPGVGLKYPTSLTAARRSKNIIRKPRKARMGSQSNGNASSSGSFGSGGAGGSMGA
jgi:hypothetical protein